MEKSQPSETALSMVASLVDYPAPEVISGPSLISEYKPELIVDLLSRLCADNMMV